MWSQEASELNSFDDINIHEQRLPIIKNLEAAIATVKPTNTLFFIKKWAQKQLKQLEDSDEDELLVAKIQQEKKKRSKEVVSTRRRNAIVMAKLDQNEQYCTFSNKDSIPMNQECKSKIMLSLKQIPFLVNLGWQEINSLVDLAQLKQYVRDQKFASKGQSINRLYIVIQGTISKQDRDNMTKLGQGSSIFMQSIISLTKAQSNYIVDSDIVWICGIEAYKIYQAIQALSQKKQAVYEKILMGVNLFHTLDQEQFYRVMCMVKLLPVKKANEVILEKETPVDRLFMVLRGEFLLCKYNLIDQIVSYQSYKEGNIFGEQWFIKPTQAECSVISKTEGLLGYLIREDIEKGIAPVSRLVLRRKIKEISY